MTRIMSVDDDALTLHAEDDGNGIELDTFEDGEDESPAHKHLRLGTITRTISAGDDGGVEIDYDEEMPTVVAAAEDDEEQEEDEEENDEDAAEGDTSADAANLGGTVVSINLASLDDIEDPALTKGTSEENRMRSVLDRAFNEAVGVAPLLAMKENENGTTKDTDEIEEGEEAGDEEEGEESGEEDGEEEDDESESGEDEDSSSSDEEEDGEQNSTDEVATEQDAPPAKRSRPSEEHRQQPSTEAKRSRRKTPPNDKRRSSTPSRCGDDSRIQFLFDNARFFLIKSANPDNVEIAKAKSVWATTGRNESMLNEMFKTTRNVILVYSVERSQGFQGFARLAAESDRHGSPVRWHLPPGMDARRLGGTFRIQWVSRRELPFEKAAALTNSYNQHKPVKIGRDGQEIEATTGRRLCNMMPCDRSIDVESLVRRVKRQQQEHPHRHSTGSSSKRFDPLPRSTSDRLPKRQPSSNRRRSSPPPPPLATTTMHHTTVPYSTNGIYASGGRAGAYAVYNTSAHGYQQPAPLGLVQHAYAYPPSLDANAALWYAQPPQPLIPPGSWPPSAEEHAQHPDYHSHVSPPPLRSRTPPPPGIGSSLHRRGRTDNPRRRRKRERPTSKSYATKANAEPIRTRNPIANRLGTMSGDLKRRRDSSSRRRAVGGADTAAAIPSLLTNTSRRSAASPPASYKQHHRRVSPIRRGVGRSQRPSLMTQRTRDRPLERKPEQRSRNDRHSRERRR